MTLYSDVIKTNYIKSIEKSLVKKKSYQRFPNNIEIENVLFEKDVYSIQSKNSIYFLELLENHNNKEFVSIDNPNITIEHIFPQNPDKSWYNSLNEEEIKLFKEKFLNTISNLTLSGNNGSLSNKSFEEKKIMNRDGKEQGYVYSRLWLNTYLKQIDNWDINKLQERYKILLERFLQIWKFPDVIIEDDNLLNNRGWVPEEVIFPSCILKFSNKIKNYPTNSHKNNFQSLDEIKKLLNKEIDFIPHVYFNNQPENEIFIIHRVDYDYDNTIRKYIRELV